MLLLHNIFSTLYFFSNKKNTQNRKKMSNKKEKEEEEKEINHGMNIRLLKKKFHEKMNQNKKIDKILIDFLSNISSECDFTPYIFSINFDFNDFKRNDKIDKIINKLFKYVDLTEMVSQFYFISFSDGADNLTITRQKKAYRVSLILLAEFQLLAG